MTRVRAILWLVLFTLALPVLFILFARWQAANAANSAAFVWGDPHIGVVVDTTDGLQPELDGLAMAWDQNDIGWVPTLTHHLVSFKDEASYLGSTESAEAFGNWLKGLTAEGGGGCRDDALRALLSMARQLPDGKTPDSDVLLLAGSTPLGTRQTIAFVVDKLLQRGVRVHTMLSGWCDEAPLPEAVMGYLALATGGTLHYPITPTNYVSESLIALNLMSASDNLLSRFGTVSEGQPEIIPLGLDGTVTTLGVDGEDDQFKCPPWCCLTCTAPLPIAPLLMPEPGNVQVELLDPDGTVVGPGTPGYSLLHSAGHQLIRLQPPESEPLKTGLWAVRVSGAGSYEINVVANSTLHLAYLGRQSLPLNRPVPIRAALIEESGQSTPLTASFWLVSLDGQQAYPIALFDDGQHGDGESGDGLYGGLITPGKPGLWRLTAQGKLSDETPFRRIDPAPIRVQRFRLEDRPEAFLLPGSIHTTTFELINDSTARENGSTTFDLALYSELGWTNTDTVPVSVTLAAGESFRLDVKVVIPQGAPIGAVEEATLVAVPQGDLGGGASTVARMMVVDQVAVYLPVVIKQS